MLILNNLKKYILILVLISLTGCLGSGGSDDSDDSTTISPQDLFGTCYIAPERAVYNFSNVKMDVNFEYDNQNRLIKKITSIDFNKDGTVDRYFVEEFSYDNSNRLISERSAVDVNNDNVFDRSFLIEYSYDGNGCLISEKMSVDFDNDAIVDSSYMITCSYDQYRMISLEFEADHDNDGVPDRLVFLKNISYDLENRIESAEECFDYDADGNIDIVYRINYHYNGEELDSVVCDDGVLKIVYSYNYDQNGWLASIEGKLDNYEYQFFSSDYQYDDKGWLTKTTIEDEYAVTEMDFKYNKSSALTYFEYNGNTWSPYNDFSVSITPSNICWNLDYLDPFFNISFLNNAVNTYNVNIYSYLNNAKKFVYTYYFFSHLNGIHDGIINILFQVLGGFPFDDWFYDYLSQEDLS